MLIPNSVFAPKQSKLRAATTWGVRFFSQTRSMGMPITIATRSPSGSLPTPSIYKLTIGFAGVGCLLAEKPRHVIDLLPISLGFSNDGAVPAARILFQYL